MQRIQGKVVLSETGVVAPDLKVVAYEINPDNLPAELRQDPPAAGPDIWQKLIGRRLGSALTDEKGAFALEVEKEPAGVPDKDRHLMLFVVAPDDGQRGAAGPAVLHVARGGTPAAGGAESFLVRVPAQRLTQNNLLAARNAGPLRGEIPANAEPSEELFSVRYRRLQEENADRFEAPAEVRPHTAAGAFGARFTDLAGEPAGFEVTVNETTNSLRLAEGGANPVNLAYRGLRYQSAEERASLLETGTELVVDRQKREAFLAVLPSPHTLRTDDGLSPLFRWYRQQTR